MTENDEQKFDRTYVSVDLGAIRHNIMQERKKLDKDTKILAVVKADAYGHGAVPVSKALYDLVDAYGVATIEEGIELREAGIDKMILVLGYTGICHFSDLIGYDISQTVYSYEMAEELNKEALRLGKKARIHIKLDTGMGRIGFSPKKENIMVIKQISQLPGIDMEGIFTHFARADETSLEPVKEPLRQYREFSDALEKKGVKIPIHHAANSASIMRFKESNMDMVRSGITTYGMYPSEEVEKELLDIRPAMEWKACISYIKEVPAGTPIGYGGTYVTEKTATIATVAVGYADGLKRDLSGKGHVLVCGKKAPIRGRICMDQFMIDVSDIPEAKAGDYVTIFGRDGGEFLPVEEVAELSHSFNYEYVCGITGRVPRKYKNCNQME